MKMRLGHPSFRSFASTMLQGCTDVASRRGKSERGILLPDHEVGGGDRYWEGASCHGCLLISEPSGEPMNTYLDRTLVVGTVESSDAAFLKGREGGDGHRIQ